MSAIGHTRIVPGGSKMTALERNRKWRASFPPGSCATCGRERAPGKKCCASCLKRAASSRAATPLGTCTSCRNRPSAPERAYCARCIASQKAYRDSGKRKRWKRPTIFTRMTFCSKCVSERLVNRRCPSCALVYDRRYRDRNRDHMNVLYERRYYRLKDAEGSHTAAEWRAVLKKHGHKCAACNTSGDLTKDHIVPVSQGGSNYAFNLQPLCRPCNSAKHNRILAGVQFSLFDRVPA